MIEAVEIVFDHLNHVYKKKGTDITFTSVTQRLDKVVPVFDEDYWSLAKAIERIFVNKNGWDSWNNAKRDYGFKALVEHFKTIMPIELINTTKNNILDEWRIKKEAACEFGNMIHAIPEASINASITNRKEKYVRISNIIEMNIPIHEILNGYFTHVDIKLLEKTPLRTKYPDVYRQVVFYIKQGFSLYSECRVYDVDHLVSGTIDLLLVKGKFFIIIDWKTNEELPKFEAGYFKKRNNVKTEEFVKTKETLLYPVDHLPNAKGIIHSLQLSMYANLMERFGLKCVGLELYHLREKTTKFNIKYYKNEASLLINLNLN